MLKGTHNQEKCITINYKICKNSKGKNKLKELSVQKKKENGGFIGSDQHKRDGKWGQTMEKKTHGIW